jgi:uncharacterized protein YoaH (UPF0181 family)
MSDSESLTRPPYGGIMRQKPWEAVGMSRATWYRKGKPTEKPKSKVPQKQLAKTLGVSIRTIQRDAASLREDEWRKRVAMVRRYMAQGYTQDEACGLTAAELRASAIEGLISEGRLVLFAQASQYAAKVAAK